VKTKRHLISATIWCTLLCSIHLRRAYSTWLQPKLFICKFKRNRFDTFCSAPFASLRGEQVSCKWEALGLRTGRVCDSAPTQSPFLVSSSGVCCKSYHCERWFGTICLFRCMHKGWQASSTEQFGVESNTSDKENRLLLRHCLSSWVRLVLRSVDKQKELSGLMNVSYIFFTCQEVPIHWCLPKGRWRGVRPKRFRSLI